MLNGIVGYQLLDDGTAVSLGLMLISAAILFVGTGYIALDTGLGWTDFFKADTSGQDQSYALYTLYQLAPIVFLVVFFLLEAFLVLRILGERKPMRRFKIATPLGAYTDYIASISHRSSSAVRHRPDFPIRHQRPHMYRHLAQDQRRSLRDSIHPTFCGDDMGVLVEYHGGRLANAGDKLGDVLVEFGYGLGVERHWLSFSERWVSPIISECLMRDTE